MGTTGLTYQALEHMPEDGLRREIIGGELFVTAAPATRHQDIVFELALRLREHAAGVGGRMLMGVGVHFADVDFPIPDVIYLGPASSALVETTFVSGAPDLVVEVSSPSTRRTDLTRKKDLYARYGVAEYWFVDLDVDRVEIFRLTGTGYGQPLIVGRGEVLESPLLPGFALSIDELLGDPET
jgi:Uma2 family endonuclease